MPINPRKAIISLDENFILTITKGKKQHDWVLSRCSEHDMSTIDGSSWARGDESKDSAGRDFMGALHEGCNAHEALLLKEKKA